MIGFAGRKQAGARDDDHDRVQIDPDGVQTQRRGSVGRGPAAVPRIQHDGAVRQLGALQQLAGEELRVACVVREEAFPPGLQAFVPLRRNDASSW